MFFGCSEYTFRYGIRFYDGMLLELEGFEDDIIEKETHGNNLVQAKDK